MKLRQLFVAILLLISININAAYILIYEESDHGINLQGGITKKLLIFKIGEIYNAIKFGDDKGFLVQYRKPPFIFGFNGGLSTQLSLEMSERFLSLLKRPAKNVLKFSASPEMIDPLTGLKCTELPKKVPCANIFNFIVLGIIDESGVGFCVQSSDKIDLLTAVDDGTLKISDVVLFRNTHTNRIGNVMLYIGNNVLVGWDGEYFFFQSIHQAMEYWAQIFQYTIEISREVFPFSDIENARDVMKFKSNSSELNYEYNSASFPLDTNNLPSYIK